MEKKTESKVGEISGYTVEAKSRVSSCGNIRDRPLRLGGS